MADVLVAPAPRLAPGQAVQVPLPGTRFVVAWPDGTEEDAEVVGVRGMFVEFRAGNFVRGMTLDAWTWKHGERARYRWAAC